MRRRRKLKKLAYIHCTCFAKFPGNNFVIISGFADRRKFSADTGLVTTVLEGSLLNLRRLKSATKTFQTLVRELLFADDAALVAHTAATLQCLVSCLAD